MPSDNEAQSKTILLVDDNSDVLTVFSIGLQSIGYEAIKCASGAEAIEAYTLNRPSIALIDLGLPDMTGIEVGRQIKQLDSQNSTTIALLTGSDGVELRSQAAAVGFDTVLNKPLGIRKLNQWILDADADSQGTAQPSSLDS